MQATFGMVHGRFQPFHLGHLDYAKKAAMRCEHLIVGITNPDPFEIEQEASSDHRHLAESNPYTYFQRAEMIRAALIDEGFDLRKVSLIPFSVHHPEKWPYYLPPAANVVQFIRVFSEWEQTKAERLREHGFTVEILDKGAPKEYAGVDVRGRMEAGDGWKERVPPSVAEVIKQVHAGTI